MSRLVIDVSGEQHRKIKALATFEGKSIKNYVLDRLFPANEEGEGDAWAKLQTLLKERIQKAEGNPSAKKTFEQLTQEIINKKG